MAKKKATRKTSKTRTTKSSTAPSTRSAKKKAATKKSTKKGAADSKRSAGEEEVTIDRRAAERRDDATNAAADAKATAAKKAAPLERRKKVTRRRQIDPTTCERDYTDSEVEFMNALDEYKRKNGRMFPTCSEVLEVIRDLGYVQLSASEIARRRVEENDTIDGAARAFDDDETDVFDVSSDDDESTGAVLEPSTADAAV